MNNDKFQQELLAAVIAIRDTQRALLEQLAAQRALAEQQVKKSMATVDESIGLQRLALQRQRTVTLVAVPGILACIAAIGYLVLKYF